MKYARDLWQVGDQNTEITNPIEDIEGAIFEPRWR